MHYIIYPIGDVTLKHFDWWIMGFFGLVFLVMAQSYAQYMKWKTGKTVGICVVFAVIGALLGYLLYNSLGLPNERQFLDININAYGLMLVIAFIAGTIVIIRLGKREGVSMETVLDLVLVIIIGALIGSRLVYVALKYTDYAENIKSIMYIWEGGLSVHGGVLGAMIAGWIYVSIRKLSYWKLADIVAPGLALGTVFGRIGCFLNGCCYGVACANSNAWYGVVFPANNPHIADAADRILRHPAQLYMMLLNLIVFLIIFNMFKNKRFDGHIFLMWLGLYSIARFFQEFYRFQVSSDVIFGRITVAQLASIILAIIAFIIIAEMKKRKDIEEKLLIEGKAKKAARLEQTVVDEKKESEN